MKLTLDSGRSAAAGCSQNYLASSPFGLVSAVIHFSRFPTFLLAAARRWLGTPVTHFFDDFKGTVLEQYAETSWQLFDELIGILGLLFDPDKDVKPAQAGPFLGAFEDYSNIPTSARIQVSPKPVFVSNLRQALAEILRSGRIPQEHRKSLVGKLLHLSSMQEGRFGRGQTFALSVSDEYSVEQALNCIRFHVALIDMKLHRNIDLRPWER